MPLYQYTNPCWQVPWILASIYKQRQLLVGYSSYTLNNICTKMPASTCTANLYLLYLKTHTTDWKINEIIHNLLEKIIINISLHLSNMILNSECQKKKKKQHAFNKYSSGISRYIVQVLRGGCCTDRPPWPNTQRYLYLTTWQCMAIYLLINNRSYS